jgi:hypothetical protein
MAHRLSTTKAFMIGNGVLAFAVIVVVCTFVFFSMRTYNRQLATPIYDEIYTLTLSQGFAGDSIAIYVNDSLLMDARITTIPASVSVGRLAEDNVALIVDQTTDLVTTFDLSRKGGDYTFTRDDDGIKLAGKQ